ncbi:MAG: hypothetical protein K8U57_31610 [Planctomycetes bacterium]|nr:hypothetical protein [Planctomycetota bacterium]
MIAIPLILRDGFGEPIPLTDAQQLRVRWWSLMLVWASNGLLDTDPRIEAQPRRLAAAFAEHDVEWLCELVQCATGTKYPA